MLYEKKQTKFTFRLTDRQVKMLNAIKEKEDAPISVIVRKAIDNFIAKYEEDNGCCNNNDVCYKNKPKFERLDYKLDS